MRKKYYEAKDFSTSLEMTYQISEIAPQVFENTPRVFEIIPQVFETVPQVFEITPRVFEIVPQVFEIVPQVFEIASRVFEIIPQVFETVPQVFEIIPQVFEIVSQVFSRAYQVYEIKIKQERNYKPLKSNKMKQEQNNDLSMLQSTMLLLINFSSAWSANAAITNVVNQLQAHLTAVLNADQVQKTSTIGVTQTKEAAKESLIAATIGIANAGFAYAAATNNLALKASCKVVLSDLTHAKDNDLTGICQNVHDAVNPFIANMTTYGATAASLATQQAAVTNFSGMVGKPRTVRAISIDATLGIDQHLRAAKTLLDEQMDTLLGQFLTSNPHFHNQYVAARVVQDYGHRKTVILKGFIYTNNNHALAGALVTIGGTAVHKKFSKVDGSYKFMRLHVGTYTITISMAGYVTQTKTVIVTQNGTVQTDFVMVAVANNTTPTANTSNA